MSFAGGKMVTPGYAIAEPNEGRENLELDRADASNELDEADLARLRKKPMITRKFGFMSMLGFSCTVLITWEGATVLFIEAFENGGPAGVIYGFILIWIGTLSVFTTLSELASMIPSAAGQYFWCYMLAPQSCRKFLSYLTGWLIVGGWQAFVASGCFLTATMIQGFIVLVNPTYDHQSWHGTLLFYLVILVAVLVNTSLASMLPKVEGLILILHVVGFFAIWIPLVSYNPYKPASEVFGTFLNEGGWQTQGLSFMVGLLGNVFAFFGADSAVHMSEEVKRASVVVPQTILTSIVINGIMGFTILVVLLFSITDLDGALKSRTGYPFMAIFYQSTRSVWGSALMTAIIITLSWCALFGVLASASRVLWAFSRDRGVPGWTHIRKVQIKNSVPATAVAITTTVSCLLALINIGSATAFNDVVSLSVAALFASYMMAAFLLLWRRCRGDIKSSNLSTYSIDADGMVTGHLAWGPWHIPGWIGTANNVFSCAYLVVIFFFSFWPSHKDPGPSGMNYSSLMLGALVIFAVVYYIVRARKTFKGPVVEI